MRSTTLIALAAAALAVAAPVAVAQMTPAPVQPQQARHATSYLFAFSTETAQMASMAGGKDAHTCSVPMRSVQHEMTWFTGRPDRDAGSLPMEAFVWLWSRPGADSFAEDPPNVDLDFTVGGAERDRPGMRRARKGRSANAARQWFRTPTILTNASVVVGNFNAPGGSTAPAARIHGRLRPHARARHG